MDGLPICLTVPIDPSATAGERIHSHEHHELVYILEGEGWQTNDQNRYAVLPGQFYLFPAGIAHAAYCEEGQRQRLFVLYVPESYFASSIWEADLASAWNRVIAHCATDALIDLGGDRLARESAAELVGTMSREFGEKRAGYGAAVRVCFSELLLLIMRSSWWQSNIPDRLASPSARQLIGEVESFIRANWYREIRVDDVLSVCNISRSHFHALFRRYTGQTFVDYVNGVRIEQAMSRLTDTDRPVSEIGGACGFARPAYFASVFRKRVGMTPREYRRSVCASE